MRGNDLAEEIIVRLPRPSAMKLQKLLYYVDSWHLAVTGERLITDQPFRAYVDGPVHDDVWHKRRAPSARAHATSKVNLSPTAEGILDLVLAEYGGRSGDELSALTHKEVPWLNARGDLPDWAPSREPLKDEDVARFYRDRRRLGNRTAADLAIGGVHVANPDLMRRPVILRKLMAELPPTKVGIDDDDDDPAFGANLADTRKVDFTGIGAAHRYSDEDG